jgi:hypothetical protein
MVQLLSKDLFVTCQNVEGHSLLPRLTSLALQKKQFELFRRIEWEVKLS